MVQRRCNPVSLLLEFRSLLTRPCVEICSRAWRYCIFEFVSQNCAANLLQDSDRICGRESLHLYTCAILLTPSGEITGHFGFCTVQLEVLAVCLRQQQRTQCFTVLVVFTQASQTKCRQKSELTPVNVPHSDYLL